MAVRVRRGKADKAVKQLVQALEKYQQDHPKAKIDLYRHSRFSVRIRVIDPGFAKVNLGERSSRVWKYFDDLPDEVVSDITMLLLLTPKELKTSLGNVEFEHPTPLEL
ncbi:MAG: hypothetical protein RMJ88_16450 [Thermogemmata sp.]|nr:hypothetical protein [Thermogemmata sp.]